MKKKILVIALSLALVATLSMGSLAWFTDSDSIKNDFYVGDTNTDPDKVFGLDVWETVDNQEIGRGDKTGAGTLYEAILPGQVLSKAPVLENTGIHPMYVRAFVTVSGADILIDAMGGFDWTKTDLFLAGLNTTDWTMEDVLYTVDDELVYVFTYNTALAAKTVSAPLFDSVVIPTGLTKEQAADLDMFSVSVYGQAIQSEHILCNNAVDAFAEYWDADSTLFGYEKGADAIALVLDGETVYVSDLAGIQAARAAGEKDIYAFRADINIKSENNMSGADLYVFDSVVNTTSGNYIGLAHSQNITYHDVVFNGGMFLYGVDTFTECTFNLTSNYMWTYGATEASFINCVFNTDGKAILVYTEGSDVDHVVNVEDCTFNATKTAKTATGIEVAAVSIDGSLPNGGTGTFTVNFAGTNAVDGNFNGLYQLKCNNVKNNVTVNNNGTVSYIANGQDDLDAAIAAAAEGEVIALDAGTYTVSGDNKVVIVGSGADTVININGNIQNADISNATITGGDSLNVKANGVTFTNVIFDGNVGNVSQGVVKGDMTFTDCTFNAGFHIDSSIAGVNVAFVGCTFDEYAYIKLGGSANYSMTDCVIETLASDATGPWGRQWVISYSDITFTNCEIGRVIRAGGAITITLDGCVDENNVAVTDAIVHTYNAPTVVIK